MKKTTKGAVVLGVLGVLAVSSCGREASEEPPQANPLDEAYFSEDTDQELVDYLHETFGVSLGVYRNSVVISHDDDGTTTWESSADFLVEGFGEKALDLDVIYYPASEGGDVSLYVGDVESGDERYFLYNEQEAFIVFSQDVDPENIKGAGVGKLEDGSYEVWVFDDRVDGGRDQLQSVANGYEALRVVEQYNDFSDIDPHVMLTAIAIGHTDLPEARGPISCDDTARKPAVCTIFKEFCDCAACLTLGREDGTCGLCPQL